MDEYNKRELHTFLNFSLVILLDFYQQRASSFFTSMSRDIKLYPLCFHPKVLQGSQKVKVRMMFSVDYKSS